MTLENQVVSLELAKRLKELGVKQESLFMWEQGFGKGYLKTTYAFRERFHLQYEEGLCRTADLKSQYAAFTVAELGEMLSDGIDMTWKSSTGEWNCRYTLVSHDGNAVGTSAATEADARAKMLIYLKEQGLINEV